MLKKNCWGWKCGKGKCNSVPQFSFPAFFSVACGPVTADNSAYYLMINACFFKISNSPVPITDGTSSIIDSPLSSSVTPSLFYSRLKTFLFLKSFPSSSSGLTPRTPGLFTDTSEHIRLFLFCSFWFRAVD